MPDIARGKSRRLSPMQRQTSKLLSNSRAETVEVTVFAEIDVTALVRLRTERRENGRPPSVTHFILAALARTLIAHPEFNAHLVGSEIHFLKSVDIGFAVSLDSGDLLSPVLRNVASRDLGNIVAAAADLAKRARSGDLILADMKGAGFTFSSVGQAKAARFATVVLPVPQVAILAAMAIYDTPVVCDGKVGIGSVLPVSLSFDHRAVNGAAATEFLDTLAAHLARPETLFAAANSTEGPSA